MTELIWKCYRSPVNREGLKIHK